MLYHCKLVTGIPIILLSTTLSSRTVSGIDFTTRPYKYISGLYYCELVTKFPFVPLSTTLPSECSSLHCYLLCPVLDNLQALFIESLLHAQDRPLLFCSSQYGSFLFTINTSSSQPPISHFLFVFNRLLSSPLNIIHENKRHHVYSLAQDTNSYVWSDIIMKCIRQW